MVKEVNVRRGDNAKQEIYQQVTVLSRVLHRSIFFHLFLIFIHDISSLLEFLYFLRQYTIIHDKLILTSLNQ